MKFTSRLTAAILALGAITVLTGCQDPEPGKGGTIPPAWDEPSAARVNDAGIKGNGWDSKDETPGDWTSGANEGELDKNTGVRRVEVAGFPKTVYFGYDTDKVSASEAGKIADAAAFLKSRSDLVLVIEGHCDERGTEEYNRALGERRARAVESKLGSQGVDLAAIRTVSYGEDKPAVTGSTESAWKQNRRAILWVGKAN